MSEPSKAETLGDEHRALTRSIDKVVEGRQERLREQIQAAVRDLEDAVGVRVTAIDVDLVDARAVGQGGAPTTLVVAADISWE